MGRPNLRSKPSTNWRSGRRSLIRGFAPGTVGRVLRNEGDGEDREGPGMTERFMTMDGLPPRKINIRCSVCDSEWADHESHSCTEVMGRRISELELRVMELERIVEQLLPDLR